MCQCFVYIFFAADNFLYLLYCNYKRSDMNIDKSSTSESEKSYQSGISAEGLAESVPDASNIIDKRKIRNVKVASRKPFVPVRLRKKLEKKCFTDGKQVTDETVVDIDKELCPFRPPTSMEFISHRVMGIYRKNIIQDKELKKPTHKKLSLHGTLNKNLFDRLYVKVPPPDGTLTITDYDKDYFKLVEGRPHGAEFNLKDYVETVRNVLRTKILLGFREDDILWINQDIENEQRTIHSIQKNLQRYCKIFDEILERDHLSATETLRQADVTANQLFEMNLEYKNLKKKYNSLKGGLYSSEEKWNNCKMYQKFLFYVSPLHWKKENADQIVDSGDLVEVSSYNEEHMFDEKSLESKEISIDTMLEYIHYDCKNAVAPKLYFTHPSEILEIFKYMETQNLNYLLHAEALAFPLENIKHSMNVANAIFDKKISQMYNCVTELSKDIEWEEYKAEELEKMAMSLIYNDFKELIMSEDILNLHVFVEDVYESKIGPNDANLNVLEMMTSIETKYRADVLALDKIPHEIVASLEGSCFNEQSKMMKLAEKAVKQFQELEVLTKQLKRAYAPKYEKGRGKEAKNRSKLATRAKPKPPPPIELTYDEQEYLEYFTDFCKYTDNPKDYDFGLKTSCKSQQTDAVKANASLDIECVVSDQKMTCKSVVNEIEALEHLMTAQL